MKRGRLSTIILILGVSGATLLGGCGSATKTVSVTAPETPSQTTATSTQQTSAGTTTAPSTTPAQSSNGGTPGPTTTRSAPEPAFAQQGATGGEGLSAAMAVLRAKGFTAENTSDYHPNQTLRVLIGTRTGSADGYAQQAFFFVKGRYVGTDSSQPSATVRVVSQGDTEVTLAYPLYRKGDPLCCPGDGQATVRFQLDNGMLTPLGPIPPATSGTGPSRL